MGIKERIDEQILERAAWLDRPNPAVQATRRVLNLLLSYDRTMDLAIEMEDWSGPAIMDRMGEMLARDVEISGIDNIPRNGGALIVCNHPTGIADGIILWHLLSPLRPDLFFYANSDMLKVVPQLDSMIAPVEWRPDKRNHSKTRETMAFTRNAMGDGRLGIIFPSGRLAKRRGLRLHERPWMSSAAMIARKFDVPVIPMNIRSRNSALFYLFDFIHPSLRDITLFYETLNKAKQPFRIAVGEPISPKALPKDADSAIARLRDATLELGGRHAPDVSLVDVTRRPSWVSARASETSSRL
ncbi:Putative hemolysin [Palleronia marisminoris]|uniref:2-acyl-glycerophospho-ethanolamine acyltransferase n=1 Tax=Palleronia marisminoris TaxID=315423 RepID=A0A1Y5RHP6_9RHOB|nr:1-acyl-sn-glycerol-3-phosphate acyltransferase [Palleronia marisminoris]SFG22197.1 Putative hemolysin [Palleronia marisminoris]SLN17683.1 2-acyl-glycerophospho-ethanolamine acyltransferase [Palleronia marisminoris]